MSGQGSRLLNNQNQLEEKNLLGSVLAQKIKAWQIL